MRRQTNSCERVEHNSRKRTKQNGDKQSTICRVQNTGYKMVSECKTRVDEVKENFDNIKKVMEKIIENQSEMKDTLTEIIIYRALTVE